MTAAKTWIHAERVEAARIAAEKVAKELLKKVVALPGLSKVLEYPRFKGPNIGR